MNSYKRKGIFMSWFLRHGLTERKITYDDQGFVLLSDLLKQPEMKIITLDEVVKIVETNNKKRFSFKKENDQCYINALQGHSENIGKNISDDLALTKITESLGTNRRAWETIKDAGLMPMGRKHIHLASGLADDKTVVSGMRQRSSVIIYIDMKKAMDRGKVFYLSDNGVILTSDNLEPDLFLRVDK